MSRLLGVLTVLIIASTMVFGQIAGSAHDFSASSWNSSGEICIVCHTPHNANTNVTGAPLWNHQVTSSTYTLYSSFSVDASMGQPSGSSKLCLSCHDGTVAVDNFGSVTTGTTDISSANEIGTSISDDHPISFTYDDALATSDGGLYAPTTVNSGLGSTIDADLLADHKLECSSCHDVHDNGSGSFLVMANDASALCLTCHNK
ncbi:MAG: cytochrome c3 family protein [Candidatus Neomarinimicrobiota bacterium]